MTEVATFSTDLCDPNEIGRLTSWDVVFRQLSSGSEPARVHLRAGHLISTLRLKMLCRVHQTGAAPDGVITFGLPKPRTISNWLRSDLPDLSLICFGCGHEFDGVSEVGFDGWTISVDRADAEALAQSFGLELPSDVSVPKIVDLSPDARATGELLQRTMAHSDGIGDAASHADEEELLLALVLAVSNAKHRVGDGTERNRDRVLRRALDVIEARADDPPSIRKLCVMSGTSWPTLHRAFIDRFGISPKVYLKALRLNKARQDLLSGEVRWVADAANTWGFWHMGQFAKEYRELFNRLPSEDLKR